MMKEFSMHILDIAQNSVKANATDIMIKIDEDVINNKLSFYIEDNGKGMSEEMVAAVRNPFTTSRTTRKVGLGIPFLEQTCLQCGGGLNIDSTPGVGTKLSATLEYNNIDRPPMGDIAASMLILITANVDLNFKYIHIYNGKEFVLDTSEVREVLEDVPLNDPNVVEWLKENMSEGLKEIREE